LEVPNLHYSQCAVENETNVDIEGFELNLQYDSSRVTILRHGAALVGSPDCVLELTKEYVESSSAVSRLPEGDERNLAQGSLANRRDFGVPVLNRGAKIQIDFLVTNWGVEPLNLRVSCIGKGVRMKERPPKPEWFGVPTAARADPGMIPSVVEETRRYSTPVLSVPRPPDGARYRASRGAPVR
jgi:hypothetical protein